MFTCERSLQGLALIVKASKTDKIRDEDIILDPIFPVDNLLEQKNESTGDTTKKELIQNNTVEVDSREQPNARENDRTEAIQETDAKDLKTPTKKQPIISVAFPKNVPTIKDIRRRQRK